MKGRWISIDGCGGSGKTTLANRLKEKYPEVTYIPEFSEELTGVALQKAVKQGAYIISNSKIGSSLLFLSDYFLMCESIICPNIDNGHTVISDRGFLSKIAVQDVIMSEKYDKNLVENCLVQLFRLGPIPDYSINLDVPLDIIKSRIRERDGFFYTGQEELIKATKRRIEDYAQIFHIRTIRICNVEDMEKFIAHSAEYLY